MRISTDLYRENLSKIDWRTATTVEGALQVLAEDEVDLVLTSICGWGGFSRCHRKQFNILITPLRARGDWTRVKNCSIESTLRLPGIPVLLLSLAESDRDSDVEGTVDDELFTACVRGGGARGLIVSQFIDGMVSGWQRQRDALEATLIDTCHRLHRLRRLLARWDGSGRF